MIMAQPGDAPRGTEDAIQPVRLVRDSFAGAHAGSAIPQLSPPWLVGSALFLAMLTLLAAAWWRRCRVAPVERAFRRLCGLLRLTGAERELLRSLAAPRQGERESRALHPAALLLSQSAFIRAAAELDREGAPASVIAELHRKIFNASGA